MKDLFRAKQIASLVIVTNTKYSVFQGNTVLYTSEFKVLDWQGFHYIL